MGKSGTTGFAIQPGQKWAVVVEMAGYKEDRVVGMMREESGEGCNCIVIWKDDSGGKYSVFLNST